MLDVSGVGYEVFVPVRSLARLPVSERAVLHVHTHVREEALTLYGFADPADRDMFLLLTTVNGVVPKIAIGVLSSVGIDTLRELIASDPFRSFRLPPGAKRVVTFLGRAPALELTLPIELDGARILEQRASEVLSAYVPSPRGPAFMVLIEKTFGKGVTTRTWDTLLKVAR